MRSLLFIVIASLVPAATAWPCARPPPMRSELALLTPADATLPGDGAILVVRREVPARNRDAADRDAQWKLEDGNGHEIAFTVEDLGSSVERWVPSSAADRELVLRDEAGKRVATLHQTKATSGRLAAPRPKSLTSTVSLAEARTMTMGVPGGTMKLELSADAPADTRFLTIAISGSGARAHSAITPAEHQRAFEATSYAHKSCARGGPGPIFAGERVALTWVDQLGRRSPAAQLTATKQH